MALRSSALVAVAGLLAGRTATAAALPAGCPDYSAYSMQPHPPLSNGSYQLGYMRPEPACRTFNSSAVEKTLASVGDAIADPDLRRLFTNAFPNTLDTAIRWTGFAADDPDQELTFVITGDINAMWLRDSANQMQSYRTLLTPASKLATRAESAAPYTNGTANGTANNTTSAGDLGSLYRGVINLQARYLLQSPFCNSFQPPVESGIAPASNGAASADSVTPGYNGNEVFECKYELDSLAAFLEVSADYYQATGDAAFFGRFRWLDALQAVLRTATAMMTPTYGANGTVLASPYRFTRETTRATETLANDGLGSPVAGGTGLIRSAFRPSDDSTLLQLFIPANMMFAHYLEQTAQIVDRLHGVAPAGLAARMHGFAAELRGAILRYGVVSDRSLNAFGGPAAAVYAYEVDGFGGTVLMDDANIPSLLAAPFFGFTSIHDPVYQNTRKAVLSTAAVAAPGGGGGSKGGNRFNTNPYYMHGPVISAVGGPHQGPGFAWPMASIVRILTSDDDDEIADQLQMLVRSTSGLGLIHESVNTFDETKWTRQWFSWANGLFGQMILDLKKRKPGLLQRSYQP
ncbi:DUF1237 domain containing protein [Niveomyces insectorum RCEF 264]|uniref:DUF1237 domain containing protein n=1 Tax=Niveomyces insectorum RCEF 264 TaxID=1081102 RepID=A0A167UUT4_9HYPO|nr:DUF1237 domain containing protein [Niveomyces insectorum RCEF 264]